MLKKLSPDEVKLGKDALSRSEEELIAIIIQGYDRDDVARVTLDVLNRKKLATAAWALFFATAALVIVTGILALATFIQG